MIAWPSPAEPGVWVAVATFALVPWLVRSLWDIRGRIASMLQQL